MRVLHAFGAWALMFEASVGLCIFVMYLLDDDFIFGLLFGIIVWVIIWLITFEHFLVIVPPKTIYGYINMLWGRPEGDERVSIRGIGEGIHFKYPWETMFVETTATKITLKPPASKGLPDGTERYPAADGTEMEVTWLVQYRANKDDFDTFISSDPSTLEVVNNLPHSNIMNLGIIGEIRSIIGQEIRARTGDRCIDEKDTIREKLEKSGEGTPRTILEQHYGVIIESLIISVIDYSPNVRKSRESTIRMERLHGAAQNLIDEYEKRLFNYDALEQAKAEIQANFRQKKNRDPSIRVPHGDRLVDLAKERIRKTVKPFSFMDALNVVMTVDGNIENIFIQSGGDHGSAGDIVKAAALLRKNKHNRGNQLGN